MNTSRTARSKTAITLILAFALALIWVIGELSDEPHEDAPPTPAASGSWADITPTRIDEGVLASLEVAPAMPRTGYERDAFGPAWEDVDGNGCDTRDDILARDLTEVVIDSGDDCTVDSGTLADPYTGTDIAFTRGDGNQVDIDHVIALGAAWGMGAEDWDEATREAFANDPLNLVAVDAGENRAKGDARISEWMPSNTGVQCRYAAAYVEVAAKYDLVITPPDADQLEKLAARCNA